ncbi:MAG: DUF5335 domain-containing protein [Acidobacteriia bacterium]|nr:DUF5335 domain-containing protein [Terriglobia bacterium]
MSNQTQEIPRDQWARFLDEFTREHRGSHARLEIIGGEAGAQVETENRQLDGAAADYKDGECTVWITFTSGAQPGEHLARGIHGVKAVRCLPPAGQQGAVLEVESGDGTKTVLELSHSAAYALPQGARK